MSKQREAFEAWANEKGIPLVMSKCLMLDELRPTLLAWKAWQASRAAALEEAVKAAETEHLEDPTFSADDIAYDCAVEDCVAAIRRALKEQS